MRGIRSLCAVFSRTNINDYSLDCLRRCNDVPMCRVLRNLMCWLCLVVLGIFTNLEIGRPGSKSSILGTSFGSDRRSSEYGIMLISAVRARRIAPCFTAVYFLVGPVSSTEYVICSVVVRAGVL